LCTGRQATTSSFIYSPIRWHESHRLRVVMKKSEYFKKA